MKNGNGTEKKKKMVVSLEKTFTQSSPAAPDGNQMEENDREGNSLRICPCSSGKLPPQTSNMRRVMQDSCYALKLIIPRLSKQSGFEEKENIFFIIRASFSCISTNL